MNISAVPAVVTLGRLLISPLALPFFLVYLLPFHSIILNILLAALFVLLSLTDRLEDYCAQCFPQVLMRSKQLDPIADKLLTSATLIALLAAQKIFFYWVIILIARDFFVMGLRLLAHDHNFTIPVSWLAKIKSGVQLAFLAFVILNPYQARGITSTWNLLEMALLATTLVLSLFTAKLYFDQFNNRMGVFVPNKFGANRVGESAVEEVKSESEPQRSDEPRDRE